MGPKLINCCMLEPMGTEDFGKNDEKIQALEEGRVPAKEVKTGESMEKKRRITRKESPRLLNNFAMEGLMAQKGLWKLAKEKIMKERGELPNEEGDAVRE